jgi:hypothetical protein
MFISLFREDKRVFAFYATGLTVNDRTQDKAQTNKKKIIF